MIPLNWNSKQNFSFLNPRFSKENSESLNQTLEEGIGDLKGHLFLLSSGTTATSSCDLKWVALSKTAFLASAASVNRHLESNSQDVWLNPLPSFHVGGLGILARSNLSGAKVVPLPTWDCEKFIDTVQANRVSLTSLVPAQVYDLVQRNYSCPSSIRAILVGGGALGAVLYQKARGLNWPLLPTYGMTETCSQIATASLKGFHQGSDPSMEILPHLRVEVSDQKRIRIQGESLFTGYIERQNGKGTFVDPKNEGWFYSQDCGEIFQNRIKILGRIGEFVKIGGESVEVSRLREIFDTARICSEINTDLAICPVPDDRLGHVIHLFYEFGLPAEKLSQLIQNYNSQVLAFEKIRKSHAVQKIPRTELGKLIPSQLLGLFGF